MAITSAWRVSLLAALSCKSPYLVLHKDKAVLRPHPLFLPKVVSAFHLNEDIVLPYVFVSPQRGRIALFGCGSGSPCMSVMAPFCKLDLLFNCGWSKEGPGGFFHYFSLSSLCIFKYPTSVGGPLQIPGSVSFSSGLGVCPSKFSTCYTGY